MSSEIKVDTISENTSANGVVIDGVTIKDGGITSTVADNSDNLTLISTDTDADAGPNLVLFRNSANPADNDLLGAIRFDGKDDAGNTTTYAQFISQIIDAGDGSGGSEDSSFRLQVFNNGAIRNIFQIDGGTSGQGEIVFNSPNQDMNFVVESTGNANMFKVDSGNDRIGIGVSSGNPSYSFHHAATANDLIALHHNEATSGNVFGLQIDFSSTVNDATSFFFRCMGNNRGTDRFKVESNGNVESATNSYGATSDERIKQNITDANSQWDDIKSVKVRNFKFKDDVRTEDAGGQAANTYIGLVAQEVESVSPGLVKLGLPCPSDIISDSAFGTLYEDGDAIPDGKRIGEVKEVKEQVKSVSYSVLYMKAIKALQEAMTRIETLEADVTALKGE